MIEKLRIETSRPFIDKLFAGTLSSLVKRVRPDGFCETCFGELHNVKSYGQTHYPRDSAEAAWALADTGFVNVAMRILSFSLEHIPAGQNYLPHVYDSHGTVLYNNIQTDAFAHVARALLRCHELGANAEEVLRLFEKMNNLAKSLWKNHYHPEFNLLDSGNFNEQGFCGSREPILDMFSNAACYAAFADMGKLAKSFGEQKLADDYQSWTENLAAGIETHLYDPEQGIYSAAITLANKRVELFNWISIYTWRWYPGKADAYKVAYKRLWEETANRWGALDIPSCEPQHLRLRTLGKVVAVLLAYSVENNEKKNLIDLIEFIEQTVRKPDNLWPEFWFHHAPASSEAEYYKNFFSSHGNTWISYEDDPEGDHTVDSGNCEQSSVFISHYLNHVIGCREEHNFIKIAPALSAFQHISLKNRPFGRCSSPGKLSWNLFQNQEHIQFDLKCDGASPKIKLYLPASEVDLSEASKVDGGFSEFNLIEDHAVLSFYPGKNKPYSFQCSIKKKLS